MSDKSEMNRREFIERTIKAGTAVVLAGTASYLLYDKQGPVVEKGKSNLSLPDFSIPHVEGKSITIVRGKSRAGSLKKSLDLLGGIKRFVKSGDRVVIKPNIAFASSPSMGATSHPELIHEIIIQCYNAGAKLVSVIDNPINDPAGCFLLSGIGKAVKAAGGRIIYPKKYLFEKMTLRGGRLIKNWPVLYKPLSEADKLIGTAPLKSHHRSGASMTMKNWYGILGGRRNIFHQDIHTIIAELAAMVKPTLVILDAFDVMMTNGPTGGSLSDLVQKQTIIVSTDQVAADTLGAGILGLKEHDLPFLEKAEKAGAGNRDYKSLQPVTDSEG